MAATSLACARRPLAPIELIATAAGVEAVKKLLLQVERGVYICVFERMPLNGALCRHVAVYSAASQVIFRVLTCQTKVTERRFRAANRSGHAPTSRQRPRGHGRHEFGRLLDHPATSQHQNGYRFFV
jgi:hypothetical protein